MFEMGSLSGAMLVLPSATPTSYWKGTGCQTRSLMGPRRELPSALFLEGMQPACNRDRFRGRDLGYASQRREPSDSQVDL